MPPRKFLRMNAKMLQFYAVLVKKYAYIWHAILAGYNILAIHYNQELIIEGGRVSNAE